MQTYLPAESDSLIQTYGETSSAALLLKFLSLLSALGQSADPRADRAVANAYDALVEHYRAISRALVPSPHLAYVSKQIVDGQEISAYSRAAFLAKNAPVSGNDTVSIRPDNVGHLRSNAFHLYAVSVDAQVLTTRHPIPLPDLLMRRNPGNYTHAHLVAPLGLQVRCAGELIVARRDGRLAGLIVNNRSGHFLPGRKALIDVVPTLAHAFGIPADLVFPLAVDRQPRD